MAQQHAARQLSAASKDSAFSQTSAATQPVSNTPALAANQGNSAPRPGLQQGNIATNTASDLHSQATTPTVHTEGSVLASSSQQHHARPISSKQHTYGEPPVMQQNSSDNASTAQPGSQTTKSSSGVTSMAQSTGETAPAKSAQVSTAT